MSKLKGVQLPLLTPPKLAYRVVTVNGTSVLCDKHLDQLRQNKYVKAYLTGETFNAALCDRCVPEEEL